MVENEVDSPHFSNYCSKTHEVAQRLGPDAKLHIQAIDTIYYYVVGLHDSHGNLNRANVMGTHMASKCCP